MKAKKKPMQKLKVSDLGLEKDIQPRSEILKVADPPKREGGAKVCLFYAACANTRSRTSTSSLPSSRRLAASKDCYVVCPICIYSTVQSVQPALALGRDDEQVLEGFCATLTRFGTSGITDVSGSRPLGPPHAGRATGNIGPRKTKEGCCIFTTMAKSPLSVPTPTPLTPEFTLTNYAQFFAAGGLCATLTHGALTPVDVVKTRLQLEPAGSKENMMSMARNIVSKEGPSGLLTGFGPTAVGYLIQGGTKFMGYGTYETAHDRILQEACY